MFSTATIREHYSRAHHIVYNTPSAAAEIPTPPSSIDDDNDDRWLVFVAKRMVTCKQFNKMFSTLSFREHLLRVHDIAIETPTPISRSSTDNDYDNDYDYDYDNDDAHSWLTFVTKRMMPFKSCNKMFSTLSIRDHYLRIHDIAIKIPPPISRSSTDNDDGNSLLTYAAKQKRRTGTTIERNHMVRID